MKKIYLAFLCMGFQLYVSAQCTDLFFSEYLEGASNNKALELYNPSNAAVDLSNYSISIFTNGSATASSTFYPKGLLAADETYVMVNSSADSVLLEPLADTLVGGNVLKFNGNDALVLFNGTDTVDIIGQVGVSPSSGYWDVDTGSTQDHSLIRKPAVNAGESNWTVGATQWLVYNKDSYSSLGDHSMTPCTTTSISSLMPLQEVELYPNPAHNFLFVQNLQTNATYAVYDILGNKINCSTSFTSSGLSLTISHLEKGVYIFWAKSNNKQIVKKFVKE